MGNEITFGNISDMQADPVAEETGIDLAFGNGRFITVKRSGSSNREYRACMKRVFEPHQKPGGALSTTDDVATELLKEVYAESIVVGWKGFKDGEGKDIPYTKANCIALFENADEIFDHVQTEASRFSNFARKEIEDSGK